MNAWPLCLLLALLAGAEPVLEFRVAGSSAAAVPLSALRKSIPSRVVTLSSPFTRPPGGRKRYEAFALRDLLDRAYGERWTKADYSHLSFVALDGYAAVGELARLSEEGGYLAYRDLDAKSGWEPVGARAADPAPFFVVWTGTRQTTSEEYPWPWQVGALDLIRFEDRYPKTVPSGAAEGSPERRGYALFRGRCFRCHAVNGEGGKIGPDLNEPRGVTRYRSKRLFKEFVFRPSEYRHTYMPDHRDLTPRDLEDLWRYLRRLDERRPPPRRGGSPPS